MEQLQARPQPAPFIPASAEQVLREHGVLRRFKRHEPVYAPGDPATHVFLVAQGEVRISRYTAEGRELTLEHPGPGDVFGECEILLDVPRESQAVARAETLAHAVEREALSHLVATDPRFGLWLTRVMGARQARMESRLETLLFKSANGKVAQVLLALAREHGQSLGDGVLIDYPITHQEIGNLIATTRETVSYAFMEFRQRGLISTRQRRTIVHDLDELGAVALT